MDHSFFTVGASITRRSFLKKLAGASIALSSGALAACAAAKAPASPPPTIAPKPGTEKPSLATTPAPGSATASPKAESVGSIKFGTSAGGAGEFLVQVAKQAGIDKKNGVDFEVVSFGDPTAAERALVTKQVETTFFGTISTAMAQNEGVDLVIISGYMFNHAYLIAGKEKPFSDLLDLKGKKVGTLGKTSGIYTALQVMAAEMGANWEKDFQLIQSPIQALVALLERREVEAATIFEPFASKLLISGQYKEVTGLNATWKRLTGREMLLNGVAVHRSWLRDNREKAKRLARTIMEAAKYVQDNPESFTKSQKVLGITEQQVPMVEQRMRYMFPTEWNQEMVRNAQHQVDRAVALGILPAAPKESVFSIVD